MLHSLKNAARRGARIVSFNTLRERGLERFADPQDPVQMLTPKSSPISSSYYQPNLGGDMAAVRGMVKALLETHRQRGRRRARPVRHGVYRAAQRRRRGLRRR